MRFRIVLSALLILATTLFGCTGMDFGAKADDVAADDEPVASSQSKIVSVDVSASTPAPCGIWFGATFDQADARSLAPVVDPDGMFVTHGYSTCSDAIWSCLYLHGAQPTRWCQVREFHVPGNYVANGIGTSPSSPVGIGLMDVYFRPNGPAVPNDDLGSGSF